MNQRKNYVDFWENKENKRLLQEENRCDKYDYLAAVGCGAISGIIDIFLIGAPGSSAVQNWTDEQVDKTVMRFAKQCGWSPREGKERNVASAIGFLEKKYPVNYDQRNTTDIGGAFRMGTKNHHMKSLAHAPDMIGLFFSVLNQFTSTASFLDNGHLITVKTDTYELQGHDFISRLYCGIVNWFGHVMSDVAGSSGSAGRGSGIVIPFFELFQLCNFGSFKVGENRNTLAVVATKVFQEGYDVRFGLAMAIPAIVCDLSIKFIWAIKRYFFHKKPLNECIPTKKYDDLRIMLILGNGTLCLMDGADAAARSGGNWVNFFLHLNIIAWWRLTALVLREASIRLGISCPLQKQLDAYIRINEALLSYLAELEKIDIQRYKKEIERYRELSFCLEKINDEKELNLLLFKEYRALELPLPWRGDFDDFMNSDEKLVFGDK